MTAAAPAMLIDGRPATRIDAADRGLQYGDGLFETVRWENGRVRWWPRHLQRLTEGCRRLGIAAPDGAQLAGELAAVAAGRGRALLKLIVTRGPMRRRGYRPTGDETPTRIVSAHEWPAGDGAPLTLELSAITLAHSPALAGIKHLNRLESVLAQREAARLGCEEVVMCGSRGEPVCGSMSNLIVCTEEGMVTPAVESAGVRGVLRSLALDAAQATGVPLAVATLSVEQLHSASAICCSNVRWGLRPADRFAGRALAADARIARLQAWIDAQP